MKAIKTTLQLGIIVPLIFIIISCQVSTKEVTEYAEKKSDIVDIFDKGEIVVGLSTNSTEYFVYRGKPMGFQYDLLKKFAKRYNLKLRVVVEDDLIKAMDYLRNGDIDFMAQNLTITSARKQVFSFTQPIVQTRQVLVQRAYPINSNDTVSFVNKQLELAGKTIFIQKGSAAYERLLNIQEEINASIDIIESDTLIMEDLIESVSNGTIDYAICDENVALLNKSYYKNINVSTPVSFQQNLAWALRKESEVLLDSINLWLDDFQKTNEYHYLYKKYYQSSRAIETFNSDYYSGSKGQISQYDEIVKEAADMIGWDWRLLSSLIFQESRFNPDVESWAGAFGIMQLMPATAEYFGVGKHSSVKDQIVAGVKFIDYCDKLIPESVNVHQDRVKFILAGYNVGIGHVLDAIRLAEKYGKNPDVWEDNVEYYLLNKSQAKYYQDEVVLSGYCSGTQPVRYVNEIVERYEHYRNVIPLI